MARQRNTDQHGKWRCPFCGRRFGSENERAGHAMIDHGTEIRWHPLLRKLMNLRAAVDAGDLTAIQEAAVAVLTCEPGSGGSHNHG